MQSCGSPEDITKIGLKIVRGLSMTHHEGKKESEETQVEPIKPGDPRVARKKGSLLDTCYTTSSGTKK